MGLFSRLFGQGEAPIADTDELRTALFEAACVGDRRKLERLARANQAAVLKCFPTWQKVPDDVRANSDALPNYVNAMVAVAEFFADRLGRPELMNALTGTPENNPLLKWQNSLTQARELMDALRYQEASQVLANVLIDTRSLQGTGAERYVPLTHGFLGECHFHAGDAAKAVPHFENAVALCEQSGDVEGIHAYVASLFESHRYLGQAAEAAGYAGRLADFLDSSDRQLASRWRTRRRLVARGEPLIRVVAVVDGTTLELDELTPNPEMHVKFVFERNRITLRPATVLADRGKELGSAGRFDEALEMFRDASRADQFDPDAPYQVGFTLLHLGRYAEALDAYRRVDELAPGWFQCRADSWIAEQLLLGRLDHQDLILLGTLEDGADPPKKKVAAAKKLVGQRPELPIARLHLGRNLARSGNEPEALVELRAGLSLESDPDTRTRMLTELGVLTRDAEERRTALEEAVALNGSLVAAASAAVALKLQV